MDNNQNSIFELIGKNISGEISEPEQKILDEWLNNSQDNRLLFDHIKKYEAYSGVYNDIKDLDVSTAKKLTWYKIFKFNKLKEHIEDDITSNVKRIYRGRFLGFAVTLLALTGISLAYANGWLHKSALNHRFTQIVAPKGSRTNLKLSDGSIVWLNAGSTLKYDNSFNKKDRVVYLDGEAFFKVAKNAHKPFYVKTSDISMKVLGTSFNVKAYADEGTIQTTLVTGRVVIRKNNTRDDQDKVVLKPNQKAIFFKREDKVTIDEIVNQHISAKKTGDTTEVPLVEKTHSLKKNEIVVADEVNTEQDVSWKDGYLVINHEPLEELAVKLARRYDVVFSFTNDAIKKYRYTGTIYDLTLDQVLNAIKFSSPIQYKIDKKLVTISKK